MNALQIIVVIATALISQSCADYSAAAPAPASNNYDNSAPALADYGNSQDSVPYAPADNLNNIVSTSISHPPQNKSKVLIYQPAAMVIKRKPTQLILRHPPTYVQPPPLIVHQPAPVLAKKVYVQNYPQSVKVTPLYVNVVKPKESKFFVKPKAPAHPPADYSANSNDYSTNSYAPVDYSSYSQVPAGPSYAPADYSSNSYTDNSASYVVPADYASNSLPADYYSPSYARPSVDAAYLPSNAYSQDVAAAPTDVSGAPAYAFANQDNAAAQAGYTIIQDGNAANALLNLGSPNYQAAPSAY